MVIKGDFVSADVSVYGMLCTPGVINTSPALQPRASAIVNTKQHLPPSLDPAYAPGDPLQLGRALLAMMADPPALPLVVKFALCHDLHEELGAHSGVQLYTDLTNCMESLDIGLDWVRTAVETTKRPVTEQVADDTLKQFAERVQDSLYDKVCLISVQMFGAMNVKYLTCCSTKTRPSPYPSCSRTPRANPTLSPVCSLSVTPCTTSAAFSNFQAVNVGP